MQNLFTPPKFATGCLIGVDSNIYSIIGYFQKIAKRSKWSKEDIEKVITTAKATEDYNLCLATISSHISEAVTEPKPAEGKLTNDEIDDLLEKIDVLVEKFENTLNTFDQDSDSKNKLMKTKHSELASAVCNLTYQFYNNDFYFYGTDNNNDAGSHAEFLIAHGSADVEQLVSQTAKNPNFDKETYSQFLGHLAKLVLEQIENDDQ